MRVLHVVDTLGAGGAERLLVTLLPALGREGCECFLAVRRAPFDLRAELEAADIVVVELPRRARWNLLGSAGDIARLAKSKQVSVLHAHLFFPAVCVALARVLRLTRASTCVTFHNLAYVAGVNRAGLGLVVRRLLARVLYPLGFDLLLAVSSAVAHHYRDALGLRWLPCVLYNPVDIGVLDRFVELPRAHPVRPIVVVPGRLVHEKGHEDLLEALQLVKLRGLDCVTRIIGDGPLAGTIQARRDALGLSNEVELLGSLPHADLLRAVAGATIVVVPSRHEGFGLTALEAMALGQPLVATAVGGLPEVVGDAGLLVSPRSPMCLAEAIQKLLSDKELRIDMGRRARARSERLFSLERLVFRQACFYRQMVSSVPCR